MQVIGERINATRKRIGEAVVSHNAELIKAEAIKQVEAGAHFIDVNGGVPGDATGFLPWLVDVVQEVVDVPLCLDSPHPDAIVAAIPHCKKPPLINSVTYDDESLKKLTPLFKDYGAKLIALCLSGGKPPEGLDERLEIADRLLDHLTGEGVPLDNIHVDPCVFPISTTPQAGADVLEAVERIHQKYPGVHTICGASNVSFGMPYRKLLNAVFLAMLIGRGLDSAIIDPCDKLTRANLLAADTLAGRDMYGANYLGAYRAGEIEL